MSSIAISNLRGIVGRQRAEDFTPVDAWDYAYRGLKQFLPQRVHVQRDSAFGADPRLERFDREICEVGEHPVGTR